jgi:hypothetical protein
MKVARTLAVFCALAAPTNAASVDDTSLTGDNTITKVVKILQGMLEKSKKEGEEEREIFAKFKCFCDDNEAEKKQSISDLGRSINVLSSKIEELQGSTGGLSSECAQLRTDMMNNEQARATAESVRNQENEEFVAEEADMVAGIEQMDEAITTLSEIGADQTLEAGADHEQAMAGFEGIQKMTPKVRQAIDAVKLFLNPEQQTKVGAFLQAKAPFTGTYTSQSGQIVGTLKSMRDTFKANLASARATEASQLKAHNKLMATLTKAHSEMSDSYDGKQEHLGGNDDDLAAKKTQLAEDKAQKASDEEFLAKLLVMCEDKTKEYNERKLLRSNEDAAVAEAVSILDSDEAFAAFGKTDATSTGATGFLQMSSRRVRVHMHEMSQNTKIVSVLQNANSPRAKKIAAMVQKGNPFTEVLGEIKKMLKLIVEEGKQDKENLDWCNTEREENDASHQEKVDQIDTLNGEIETLEETIDDPETGLKAQIKEAEESLESCVTSQKTETKERTEANLLYQTDIKNLVAAEDILAKAIKALRKYYDKLEERMDGYEFVQLKEDPQAPETFGNYEGQSSKGGDAIQMLEFILDETKKEETEAHSDEETAQHDYEDSMTDLKAEEADLEETLATLHETLAAKEEELFQKKEEHKATTAEKEAIEAYLLKIKPGCDFITENFDERETNRATETTAMEKAVELIKDTPAYKAAEAEKHVEGFGDCKDKCVDNEEHVDCKACMADTTIPGYCAGHKDTEGC